MYLKSLTLKGFKSFAHTTTLEMEPGVTVVVGPNGSGKSNVVDAVAWVLGAQGARALRGAKMDDVIFAGTTKLAALGRAEVSLTIDNSNREISIDLAEIKITRILFRSGESEYQINGATCRLLDIQELLSDSGVGRQQHVIVSQGNLDHILNAQPEDRRAVIEEAAGILKYRKRKEKAQRRLESTEGNLVRLQDLVREVRRQMRPLERQAQAARRHEELAGEVHALRVFAAGQELLTQEKRLQDAGATIAASGGREGELFTALEEFEAAVIRVEAELTELGSDGVGERLQQAEGLRQRARGLQALITERKRSIERARNASVDADLVASLEAEAARVGSDLLQVEEEAFELVPLSEELGNNEAETTAEQLDVDELGARAQEARGGAAAAAAVRGELGPLHKSASRAHDDVARIEARLGNIAQRRDELSASREQLLGELEEVSDHEPVRAREAQSSEAVRAGASFKVAEAQEKHREASDARVAAAARAEVLEAALDETRQRAGTKQLAGLDGVLGTLSELVSIDEGWEPAFEAAAGTALAAVVVDGVKSARDAIASLRSNDTTGRVLALLQYAPARSNAVPSGEGIHRVRDHVRSNNAGVERLLDHLIGEAVVVDGGWQQAVELVVNSPSTIAVTRDGDRFAGPAWQRGASGTGVTAAAVEEARERAELAMDEETARIAEVTEAQQRETEAVAADKISQAALSDVVARMADLTDALSRIEGEHVALNSDDQLQRSELESVVGRLAFDRARIAELEESLPLLEAAESEAHEHGAKHSSARARLEERTRALSVLRRDFEVRAAGIEQRREMLTTRKSEIEARLERTTRERLMAEQRREQLDFVDLELGNLAENVTEQISIIDAEHEALSDKRRAYLARTADIAARIEIARRDKHNCESELHALREGVRRAEIDQVEANVRYETVVEHISRQLELTIDEARAAEAPALAEGVEPVARLDELERELRILGPVNPLALAELGELEERHVFLDTQLGDVRSSRKELEELIKAVDEEIMQIFTKAYADVERNFTHLFGTLFPGGSGSIRLTDPDNMLETGVEVEARPGGKNVRKLSLLSGGERSLTAMAFLFAVFRSCPSPFYILDEVEAALDDVNLKRFLGLVEEFRNEAQLIIVTHQKRTMEAGDCLYGVSMQSGGASKVVSERVKDRDDFRKSEGVIDLTDTATEKVPV